MTRVDITERLNNLVHICRTIDEEWVAWACTDMDEARKEIERLRNLLDSQNIAHDESSIKMKVVFDLIDKEKFVEAKDQLLALKTDPEIRYPEVIRAESLIKFLED